MNILPASAPRWQANYDLGWLGFVHHHSFVADGINFLTRWWRHDHEPSVSHVLVVSGPGLCIEANGDGVDEDSLDAYFRDPKCTIYFRRPIVWTPAMGARLVTEARGYVGFKYDYELIAADALSYSLLGRVLNGLSGDELDNALTAIADNPKEMICDKLGAVILQSEPDLAWRGTLVEPARRNNPQKLFSDECTFAKDVTMIVGGDRNP